MSYLQGKQAIVTGASWGIGRAVAIYLARNGCNVIATARREDMLIETIKEVKKSGQKGLYCVADLAKTKDIINLAKFAKKNFGAIDFLVNVAFGSLESPLEEVDDNDLQEFVQISVSGTMLVTKYMLPLFSNDQGHIVNIVADWGLPMHNIITGPMSPYIAAKHAISGFSHTLRHELAMQSKPNIKVTAIYPGATAAINLEKGISYSIDDPSGDSGDLISLEDVAKSVAFVLGQEHSNVTHLVLTPPSNAYDGSVD